MNKFKLFILEEINSFLEEKQIIRTIDDFFELLRKNINKNTFAYAYYVSGARGNKYIIQNGEKIVNPYLGKILRHSKYEFNWAKSFAEAIRRYNPNYEFTGRETGFEQNKEFTMLNDSKKLPGEKILPIVINKQFYSYTTLDYKPIDKEIAEKYISAPQSIGLKPTMRSLYIKRITKLNAGGYSWVNSNPEFQYHGL